MCVTHLARWCWSGVVVDMQCSLVQQKCYVVMVLLLTWVLLLKLARGGLGGEGGCATMLWPWSSIHLLVSPLD